MPALAEHHRGHVAPDDRRHGSHVNRMTAEELFDDSPLYEAMIKELG